MTCRKNEVARRYKIEVSENLYKTFERGSQILDVSKQNLILFLIMNKYDSLYADISNGNLKNVRKKLKINYESPAYPKNTGFYLQFYVYDVADNLLKNLADELGFSKRQLTTLFLYQNGRLLYDIVSKYSKRKCTYREYLAMQLGCLGIAVTDFTRLSTAFVLDEMFINTEEAIWNHIECGVSIG